MLSVGRDIGISGFLAMSDDGVERLLLVLVKLAMPGHLRMGKAKDGQILLDQAGRQVPPGIPRRTPRRVGDETGIG